MSSSIADCKGKSIFEIGRHLKMSRDGAIAAPKSRRTLNFVAGLHVEKQSEEANHFLRRRFMLHFFGESALIMARTSIWELC